MATITAAAGGGNWSATGTWVGGVVPTAADDVVLASTSGNVTIDVNSVCRSLDCQASGNYAGTLTFSGVNYLTIGDATAGAGNRALRLSSAMTYAVGSNSVPCEPAFVTSRLLFGRGAPGRLLTTKLAVAMLLCGNWTPPPASDADRPPPAPMQQRRGGKGQGEKGRGGPARGGQSRGGQPRGGQAGGRRPPKPPGK